MNRLKDQLKKTNSPALFDLNEGNSNKDFYNSDSWGKNQFNCAFPVALSCYAHSEKIEMIYLALNNNIQVIQSKRMD